MALIGLWLVFCPPSSLPYSLRLFEAPAHHLMRRPPPRAAPPSGPSTLTSSLTSFFTTLINDPQALAIPAR